MGFLCWTKNPTHAEILQVYQILMYRILHVGTHSIHSCSLLSSLIFIIKIYYGFFFFFLLCAWYAQQHKTAVQFLKDVMMVKVRIVFEQLGHLKALAVKGQTCVFKKKPNQTIFEGDLKLALPKLASQGVVGIHN
jgi:hypothetical protein